MPEPSISLCMIVRDEEAFLGPCLESVAGLVDEAVCVDTGSRDGTRELARGAGARVLERAWDDDFAAARNAALEAARGTHALVLDADERLVRRAHAVLRDAARRRELVLGVLPLYTATHAAADPEQVAVPNAAASGVGRFFPLRDELRFERRVHEGVASAANRLRAREGGVIERLDAPIVHCGDLPEVRRARGKDARNLALLERAVAEDPSDGELVGYLLNELTRRGDTARARALGESTLAPFLRRIDRRPAGELSPDVVRFGGIYAQLELVAGRPQEALSAVRACARRHQGTHPNLCLAEGRALEALGLTVEARRAYGVCLELARRPFDVPAFEGLELQAREGLARLGGG